MVKVFLVWSVEPPLHRYVYGEVPPVAFMVAVPSKHHPQDVLDVVAEPTKIAGWVSVADAVAVQVRVSVTVTV